MRILLATDGSRFSERAARFLARHRDSIGRKADVLVLNVDPPLSRGLALELGPEEVERYHAGAGREALKPALAILARAGVAHRAQALVGDPAATIAEVAKKEKCDLVVMGSHGRGALQNLFLGSVAVKVIASGAAPVTVVR